MVKSMKMNINIFEDRAASRFFALCISEMDFKQRTWFSKEVKSLFEDKSLSEEGQYDCFKITKDDLMQLATCVAVNKELYV